MAEKKSKSNKYVYAKGRRKQSTAVVKMFEGKGKTIVNDKPIEEYFFGEFSKRKYDKPFETTDSLNRFWAKINVSGGGMRGQLDAITLALSRALSKYNPSVYRAPLKKEGLLTVDSRVRERRKAGLGGRARAKKQSPKR